VPNEQLTRFQMMHLCRRLEDGLMSAGDTKAHWTIPRQTNSRSVVTDWSTRRQQNVLNHIKPKNLT